MCGMEGASGEAETDRAAVLESLLLRAAERLGDLRPHVMAHFYRRFPEALAVFETESAGHRETLEGQMVAQTLWCLMTWVERPIEVRIVLQTTVPHHAAALQVPAPLFAGFIDAVVETIGETIAAEAAEERALLDSIHHGLLAEVAA
jgi:hypothetical protein